MKKILRIRTNKPFIATICDIGKDGKEHNKKTWIDEFNEREVKRYRRE